jgi:archaemetzincin
MPKITIVPLGNISEDILTFVTAELREQFDVMTETLLPVALPKEMFNSIRQQYPSPLVLKFLSEKFPGRVLGIIDQDLYAESLNFVFGQAFFNGRVALVSIRRLDPTFYKQKPSEKILIERVVKEAVHEVGHAFGMEHCQDVKCVMSFSNTVGDVDRKNKDLCRSCQLKLSV